VKKQFPYFLNLIAMEILFVVGAQQVITDIHKKIAMDSRAA